jgi:hypothetical protein
MWSMCVEEKACAIFHSNVDELKASVDRHWNDMSTAELVSACKAFRRLPPPHRGLHRS